MPNKQKATMKKVELIRVYLESKMSQNKASRKASPGVSPSTPLSHFMIHCILA